MILVKLENGRHLSCSNFHPMFHEKPFYRFKGSHGEQVCHHGAESWRQAALGNEAQFELCQADDVIASLPVPAGDVQQVGLEIGKVI